MIQYQVRSEPETDLGNGIHAQLCDSEFRGDRHLIQKKFWRVAQSKDQIPTKRTEVIRDIVAWVGGLEGEDAKVRDSYKPNGAAH